MVILEDVNESRGEHSAEGDAFYDYTQFGSFVCPFYTEKVISFDLSWQSCNEVVDEEAEPTFNFLIECFCVKIVYIRDAFVKLCVRQDCPARDQEELGFSLA